MSQVVFRGELQLLFQKKTNLDKLFYYNMNVKPKCLNKILYLTSKFCEHLTRDYILKIFDLV